MATQTLTRTDRYDDMTRDELYELAQERDLDGRSQMDKEELAAALRLDDLGPDCIALLLRQHEQIRDLFRQYRELSDRPSKKKEQLVGEMLTTLVKHAEIEEQVLYPAAHEELGDVDFEVNESIEEHHAAELLMAELDKMRSDDDRYDAKVTVLMEVVEHHLDEEEEDLFPRFERVDERRRREIGAGMLKVWEVAPHRPHPIKPDTPPQNVIAGLLHGAVDLMITMARFARIKLLGR